MVAEKRCDNDDEEQPYLLQVLLRQILKISLGKGNIGGDNLKKIILNALRALQIVRKHVYISLFVIYDKFTAHLHHSSL